MAKLTIHAGDFSKNGGHSVASDHFKMLPPNKWTPETISFYSIESCELASEESVKKIGGTVGWGLAGAVVLGPVGLLAGMLLGGRGKDVTFVVKLEDGRKFLATTTSKAYTKIQAALF